MLHEKAFRMLFWSLSFSCSACGGGLVTIPVFTLLPKVVTDMRNSSSQTNIMVAINLAVADAKVIHKVEIILVKGPTASPDIDWSTFDRCTTDEAGLSQIMGNMYSAIYGNTGTIMAMMIGPPCQLELIATSNLADYKKLIMITGGGELVIERPVNSTMIKTAADGKYIWTGFKSFCQRQKWRKIFIIYEDPLVTHLPNPEEKVTYANGLAALLLMNDTTAPVDLDNPPPVFTSVQFAHSRVEDYTVNLNLFSRTARIAVIVTSRPTLRQYMLKARQLSLCDGRYAFYSLDTRSDPLLRPDSTPWKSVTGKAEDTSEDGNAKAAFQALTIITETPFFAEEGFVAFAARYSAAHPTKEKPDRVPASYYDVVMYAASLIQIAAAAGTVDFTSPRTADFYAHFKRGFFGALASTQFSYPGATGPVIFDKTNQIRITSTSFFQMVDDSGTYLPTGVYDYFQSGLRIGNMTRVNNAGPPVDPPPCGYDTANPENKPGCIPLTVSEILGIVAGCVLALMLTGLAIHVRMKAVEEQKYLYSWIIKFDSVQYPRNVQEWLRRRYTIIDDGAGGIAVSDAVQAARKAVAEYESRVQDSTEHLPSNGQERRDAPQHRRLPEERKSTVVVPFVRKINHRKQGIYHTVPVTIRHCQKDVVPVTPRVLMEAKIIRSLKPNDNVVKFIGASVEWKKVAIFYEYCLKGSLQDLLANQQFELDWIMKISVITDVLRGLAFIHQSPLESHGRLTSKCCNVDARFVLKIGDHGMPSFFSLTKEEIAELKNTGEIWDMLMWTAPEHIGEYLGESAAFSARVPTDQRKSTTVHTHGFYHRLFFWKHRKIMPITSEHYDYTATTMRNGTRQGDIFSLAIILSEITLAAKPYNMFPTMTSEEIVLQVRDRITAAAPFRPVILESECGHPSLLELIQRCWAYQYNVRPGINTIRAQMKEIGEELGVGAKTSSVMDIMLSQMEEYAASLQQIISEKNRLIDAEKATCFQLFAQILPLSIAEQLRHDETVASEMYDIVTLLMCEVVNFQALVDNCAPSDIVSLATDLYEYYASAVAEFDCITVEYCNSLVLMASGLPIRNGIFNAREIGRLALTLLFKTITFKFRHKSRGRLHFRMAVNTGPVIAGIIGHPNPRYCVFGETVYVCHRILAITKGFSILCSSTAQNLLETFGSFVLTRQDELFIKGKGLCPTYNLSGETANPTMQKLESEFRMVFPEVTD